MNKFLLVLIALLPPLNASGPVRLERETPVHLKLKQALSSETAQLNEKVEFEVTDNVTVGGAVVISKGNSAWGHVADVAPVGRLMRNGRLAIDIDSVVSSNGASVKLRAGAKTPASKPANGAAGSLGALPALPFTMFQNGKAVQIPAGKQVTAYTASTFSLNGQNDAPAAARPPVPLNPQASVLPPLQAPSDYAALPVETAVHTAVVTTSAAAPPAARSPEPLANVLPSVEAASASPTPTPTPTPVVTRAAASAPQTAQIQTQASRAQSQVSTAKSKKLLTIIAIGAAVGLAGALAAKGHGTSSPAGTPTTTGGTGVTSTTIGIGGITVGGPH